MAVIRVLYGKLQIDYYDGAGKRKRKSLGLKNTRENKKKAETIKKQIEYEIAAGIINQRYKINMKRGMKISESLVEFEKRSFGNKQSTKKAYRNAVDKFILYAGDIKIKSLTTELVNEVERKMKLEKKKNKELVSGNTVASYINRLHILFHFLAKENFIEANPFPTREITVKDIVTISDSDLYNILGKLRNKNRKHYKVVAFLLLTGLRRGEIIGLTFEKNIDFSRRIMSVFNYKRNRIDKLPLYNELEEFILTEWEKHEGLLFDYKSSESLKFFEKFLKDEGYKGYSFHTLRKTFISKLINSGMNVYDVMNLARHKDIKTTFKHYTAAELTRMGNEISSRTNINSLVVNNNEPKLKLLKTRKDIA